ncbi:MAG TPA: NmrA family NAD(P)-binding protein [Frankiaceae bacterium]|nr:NmrA family NAD(P)-binding protein [Frankiaceae bacterium]
MVVLAYGATGTQGGPVARQLVDAGERVRLLVRDPSKVRDLEARGAEVAVGDLDDLDSLRAAHEGVDRVFLHLPLQYDFALHKRYGTNAITAAREAGVDLLVMNTTAHVYPDTDVEVYNVRQHTLDELSASGVPHVVVRPTFYTDVWLGPWILPGIQNGVLAFALPEDHPFSWVSAEEVGAYCVAALRRPDLAGRTFDVAGPQVLTGAEIAATLSNLLGKPIGWVGITAADYEQALAPLVGPAVASAVAEQIRFIVGGGHGPVDMTATRTELGVDPIPLESWAKTQAWGV